MAFRLKGDAWNGGHAQYALLGFACKIPGNCKRGDSQALSQQSRSRDFACVPDHPQGRFCCTIRITLSAKQLVQRTARATQDGDRSGNNLVLYGPYGKVVSGKIRADSVTLFDYNGKSREVTGKKHKLE